MSEGSNFLCGRPHGADPSPVCMRPPEPDPSPRRKWMAPLHILLTQFMYSHCTYILM